MPAPEQLDITDFNTTMFGGALLAGRLVVTLESKVTSEHVSLDFKAWTPGANGRNVTLVNATRMYVNVAHSWDKVATIVPLPAGERIGAKVWRDKNCDDQRWWTCLKVINIALGIADVENGQWRLVLGRHCLRCGAELTEPESIEAMMGPTCRKFVSEHYGTRHQVKDISTRAPVDAPMFEAVGAVNAVVEDDGMVRLEPGESLDALFGRMMHS